MTSYAAVFPREVSIVELPLTRAVKPSVPYKCRCLLVFPTMPLGNAEKLKSAIVPKASPPGEVRQSCVAFPIPSDALSDECQRLITRYVKEMNVRARRARDRSEW